MAYTIMALMLFLSVLVIQPHWRLKIQLIIFAVMLILTVGSLLLFEVQFNDVVNKGISANITLDMFTILYEIGLYLMMLLGMAAKYMYDWLGQEKNTLFSVRSFARPFFISPIIFASVYGSMGEYTGAVFLLWAFSFQNGFFWKTVLDRQ